MSSLNTLKPIMHNDIAYYNLPKNLTTATVDVIIGRLDQHMTILRGMQIKGVALSFKECPAITDDVIKDLIEFLTLFHAKIRAFVGFINYNSKQYVQFVKLVDRSPVALFKNLEIMALSIGVSKIRPYSPILVYMKNTKEAQSIASLLISKNFFVIQARGAEDFKKRLQNRAYYDAIVVESFVSNVHDEINVTYSDGIYFYTMKGSLAENLKRFVSMRDFLYRLKLGHKVFVFDLKLIYHINIHVVQLLTEMEDFAQKIGAQVCLIHLDPSKVDSNALTRLQNSHMWLYKDKEHVFEDEDIQQLLIDSTKVASQQGLSKELLSLVQILEKTMLDTLKIFGIQNASKAQTKQISLKNLNKFKATITTHTSFGADFEGDMLFLFPQESTQMIIEHVLGGVDDFEGEDFLDAMNEFVNAVTGKLKSHMSNSQRCLAFSLPHSTALLSDVVPQDSEQLAILTSYTGLELPFYCAITYPIK